LLGWRATVAATALAAARCSLSSAARWRLSEVVVRGAQREESTGFQGAARATQPSAMHQRSRGSGSCNSTAR
jgi:hypothetical protein